MDDDRSADNVAHDAQEAADRSFASAVKAERSAIKTHRQAAALHRDRATRLDRLAENEIDEARRAGLRDQSATETARAAAADGRAGFARRRLIEEGETP